VRRRATDIVCVFQIQLARLRREAGPFLLASVVFPLVMYMFTSAVGAPGAGGVMDPSQRMRFLSGSIVFSLSLTAISWLGYLLLENRFTGRLKLFATLPLAPSSYVSGIFLFALAQAGIGTTVLLTVARMFGVRTSVSPSGALLRRRSLRSRATRSARASRASPAAPPVPCARSSAISTRSARGRVPGADLLSA
jgi:hypothetical protein